MGVRSSKSNLLTDLESVLDEQEDYIGAKPYEAIDEVYEQLDDQAYDLEKELLDAQNRIRELEEELNEAR